MPDNIGPTFSMLIEFGLYLGRDMNDLYDMQNFEENLLFFLFKIFFDLKISEPIV